MTIKEKVEGLLFIDNLPTEKQSKLIDSIIEVIKRVTKREVISLSLFWGVNR